MIALVNLDVIREFFPAGVGDRVMEECARRLKDQARFGDIVARAGGDQFAVLLIDLPESDSGLARANELFRALRTIRVGDVVMPIDARCGLARGRPFLLPSDLRFDELYERAERALTRARAFGTAVAVED
ncbi:diguanylate cyclase [Actinoplanes sp. LDG1-06]|uniref:Diguanylate cyclase n=1 Tax=Paractinoplanes ovalisporus TaxID=2810368 RepID=A0ABS2ALW5_9ACTN|nr:diguanylate cyclase [Actinoplanes ovalisporus]